MYGMINRQDLIDSAEKGHFREDIPPFRSGDTLRIQIKVREKIREKVRERLQAFEGVCIARRGVGLGKMFTVRKIGANGIGVERVFPLHSPILDSITVVHRGDVRRSKLYYLRSRIGRNAMKLRKWQPRKKPSVSAPQ